MAQLWEKQPWESDREFLWFQEYLHAGARRGLSGLASRAGCPYTSQQLATVARENHWHDRATLWDRHLAALRTKAVEDFVEESAQEEARRHRTFTRLALNLATSELSKLWAAASQATMHGTIRPETAIRMGGEAVKLDRLIRGQTTENTGHQVDLGHLSDDELRSLDTVLAKVG